MKKFVIICASLISLFSCFGCSQKASDARDTNIESERAKINSETAAVKGDEVAAAKGDEAAAVKGDEASAGKVDEASVGKVDEASAGKVDEASANLPKALSEEEKIKAIYASIKGGIDARCLNEGPIYLNEVGTYRKNKKCLDILERMEGYCILNKGTYLALECDMGDKDWDYKMKNDSFGYPSVDLPILKVPKDKDVKQAIETKTGKFCRASERKSAEDQETAQFFLCAENSSQADFDSEYEMAINHGFLDLYIAISDAKSGTSRVFASDSQLLDVAELYSEPEYNPYRDAQGSDRRIEMNLKSIESMNVMGTTFYKVIIGHKTSMTFDHSGSGYVDVIYDSNLSFIFVGSEKTRLLTYWPESGTTHTFSVENCEYDEQGVIKNESECKKETSSKRCRMTSYARQDGWGIYFETCFFD